VLADDFASTPVLTVLNVTAGAAALCLLLGYRTRLASTATTLILITLNSLVFATGKIDHGILPVLAPAVMAWSSCGDAWSLDAALGRVRHLEPERAQRRWPLAWLALIVAIAMATAGLVKLHSGWLDPAESSSYGHALANAMLNERQTRLGGMMLRMQPNVIWELTDWATIIVETAGLLAVWRACWFRAWCVALAVLHLGVALQMDIWFSSNIASYAVFVPWAAVVTPVRRRMTAINRVVPALTAVVVGLLTVRATLVWVSDTTPLITAMTRSIQRAMVLGAAPVAVWAWIASHAARSAEARDSGEAAAGSGDDTPAGVGTVTCR
jgi:hypothetical protein